MTDCKNFIFTHGLIIILLFSIPNIIPAQDIPSWQKLSNAPFVPGGRHEDGWFTDGQKGWIVNSKGEIWHTGDGGYSWVLQEKFAGTYLRCVTFADPLHGWAGSIGFASPADTIPLYQTVDGGQTWSVVENINGPKPPGLCGMWAYDSLHIYAAGRYQGPPYFLYTKDGGQTWVSQDMSDYATNLIDCYFFSPDSGYIIGQTGLYPDNSAIILFTPNGGSDWEVRFTSQIKKTHSWKISFIDPDTGYVSLQGYTDSVSYLRTVDHGRNWQELTFKTEREFSAQGICFINSQAGWIGPHPQSGRIRNIYQTVDSGISWQQVDFGRNINRFRMLSDTLGYAIGETVYKYTRENVSHLENKKSFDEPSNFILIDNYPNPFNAITNFRFSLPHTSDIEIKIYNIKGQLVDRIYRSHLSAGNHELYYEAAHLSSAVYMYIIDAGISSSTGKMILLK